MGRILIKDIYLDGKQSDILIEGNRISKIADKIEDKFTDATIIDGKGKAAIPGFANMHTHAAMTMMRGGKEDEKLQRWLSAIWSMEKHLDDEIVYWGTRLACLEMIKTGTTLFNDQYFYIDSAVKAASEMGVRGVHSYVFLDLNNKEMIEPQREKCIQEYENSKSWGDMNSFAVGVHALYSVSEENIVWAFEFAKKHGLKVHIHLAETYQELMECKGKNKCTPVEYFNSLGVISPDLIAAHCVWLSPNDIEILGRNGVNIAHNIKSNLKLASGLNFKFKELSDAGANVCLGTDGTASNNNLDMLDTMQITALVQKAWRNDPAAIPLPELMRSATYNGYKALGLDGGRIKEGALADLSIIDIDNYKFTPNINFAANLVYSANSYCIKTVICNGRIVMKDRYVEGEDEIVAQVRKLYKKLLV
ncbi:MAG: amidohydrolase [Bacteroidales bacterium]|jgi:5-methylthioadenosine/S-adenosylhomocysteine deaminase|nr:amidohydrolase [Bacteroidales bacterium]